MPDTQKNRIVLDTNLWISFLISNQFKELDSLLVSGKVTLLFSKELLDEFIDVTSRQKFRKFFNKSDISLVLELISSYGELVEVVSSIKKCRDHKDDFLLNLSFDGKANFLITGDADLLVLNNIETTKIVTWKEFLEY